MATTTMTNGAAAGPTKKGASSSIEKIYQKKTQLEHILLRPDTYIGSVERTTENMWVYNKELDKMIQKEISFVPGLYKIYDEILVNAADNKQRDPNMDCIKIDINQETNTISVWNNGRGIPVVMHKDEKMYVPTMIFGHLLTSSNYNDEEDKVTGGRNGYGAKLCNIFSSKFCVETVSEDYQLQFKQVWADNMSKTSEPKIKGGAGKDYTKITFSPDLSKFKMETLDDDIVSLMSRRAYDIAASTRGVKVFLNDVRLPVKDFKQYIDLYLRGKEDEMGSPLKVVYENVNERWEVAITSSDRGFQQVSFVNSIATTKGGRHVDNVTDNITKQLIEVLKKKNRGGITIKPFQVKNHLWVFINCLIVNPTFDSQTKENMTLQAKSFGSKCTFSEKFITAVSKCGIVESVLSWAKFKAQNELHKQSGKKQTKLKGIPKLEDANEAGSKNSQKCTLILTEGDSAKSLVVSGFAVIGRDYYGVFPLRGKLLNVREATHKQILENAEINNIIKILGLQYKKKYLVQDDLKTLRYGKLMIMTDQDQDGSHIKGLLINFIHHNWPELLQLDFLEEFITPIVKVTKKTQEISFYSLPEFEEWKRDTENHHTFKVKYYKGLGTSTSKEAKEYFQNMARHKIGFKYDGPTDDHSIQLAFSKKCIEQRKVWLTDHMNECKRRKEFGFPERYLYNKNTESVSYTEFVNLELILFSNADNVRSIPSMVDGLKPGQRKVLFTCMKRNDKREIKVAQLAGSVAEHSAYHHGEASLCMTIVNLAQNYVGSNNINLLLPNGQFGTRLSGGKDAASPRYIFTMMSPLTRLIFSPQDDPLLTHEYDDNQKIEPMWYIPIIPMVLVNGADGIGTGWMTKIPNYNPRDIIDNLRKMIEGEEPKIMTPWYKNFTGTIETWGDQRFVVSGEINILDDDKIEITELPIGTWTQSYKENVLEPMLHGSEKQKAVIADYKEYNTDTKVRMVVQTLPGEMRNMEREGLHKVFKLQSTFSTSSMVAFDELGCLRRYDAVAEILKEFFDLRLRMYVKRKDYMEGFLQAEAAKLSNQARFIVEKCDRILVVENKKRKTMIDELIKAKYDPDPIKEWKRTQENQDEEEETNPDASSQADEDEDNAGESSQASDRDAEKEFAQSSDVKKFDYLLGMSMWMLTKEKKDQLLRQRDAKLQELKVLQGKTPKDLWRADLDEFFIKLGSVEEKERKDEEMAMKKLKSGAATKGKGAKKNKLNDTLPSGQGERVIPTIGEDLQKKLTQAIKSKEKGKIKKEPSNDDKDSFDDLVASGKKTLKAKLGKSPESIEKKSLKDKLKQTKLNFKKKDVVPKKRGKKAVDLDDDILSTHSDDEMPVAAVQRTTARRVTSKPVKYSFSDNEENPMSSDSDVLLHDNVGIDTKTQPTTVLIDSDSDASVKKQPNKPESAESMFDSLIGRAPDSPVAEKRKIALVDSDSEDTKQKKVAPPKKKKLYTKEPPAVKEKKKVIKKKRTAISSDDDFSDVVDVSPVAAPQPRLNARAKKPIRYDIDSSDSD